MVQADTIIPNPYKPQDYDRYAYAANNPVKYTDPSGHWPCEGWADCIGLVTSVVKETVETVKENPINIVKKIKVNIPVVIPMNMGLEGGVVNAVIENKVAIRAGGRAVGDDLFGPGLLLTGYIASVVPEQVENIATGAPWNDFVGDFAVDTGGFIFSEAVGDLAGIGGTALFGPWGGLAGDLIFDFIAGQVWENRVDRQKYIDGLLAPAPEPQGPLPKPPQTPPPPMETPSPH